MNNPQPGDARFTGVFLYHNVHGFTPPLNSYASANCDIHKLSETSKELGVLDDGLVVAQMAARRRRGRGLLPGAKTFDDIDIIDQR